MRRPRGAAASSTAGLPSLTDRFASSDFEVESPYTVGWAAGGTQRRKRGNQLGLPGTDRAKMKALYATPGADHPTRLSGMAAFKHSMAGLAGGAVVATALAMGSGSMPAPPPPITMSTVLTPTSPTLAALTRQLQNAKAPLAAPTSVTTDSQSTQHSVLPPGPQLGTTYTNGVAESAGMTDAQAFQLMHEMGITTVRLGTYWNQIQPDGPHDARFAQLDNQLALAHKYGMKVVLTVGMKSPGWPEGYLPSWAAPKTLTRDPQNLLQKADGWLADHWTWYRQNHPDIQPGTNLAQDPGLRQHALDYERMVVGHVSGNHDVVAFQVENEPGVEFGPVKDYVGTDFVLQEANAIRNADPQHRALALNLGLPMNAEQKQLALNPEFKLVGLDVYPEPGTHVLGKDRPVTIGEEDRMVDAPTHTRQMLQAAGKQVYISEMQAEPWNPVPWNAQKSMDNFDAQRRNGFDQIMPWNLGFVLRQYAKGDQSEFKAWKQMSQDLHDGTPPPAAPHSTPWDQVSNDWRDLQEFWSGQDTSGHLQ